MPPFRYAWPIYLSGLLLAGLLAYAFRSLSHPRDADDWLVFLGLVLTATTFFAGAVINWKNGTLQRAQETLQVMRTSGEYLKHAYVVRRYVKVLGRPLSPHTMAAFRDRRPSLSLDRPSFRGASLFVLNQYEFLAAGVRSGAADYTLVETTMRGPLIALVRTYAPVINEFRATNPDALANLLWLYRRFRGMPPHDLGPIP